MCSKLWSISYIFLFLIRCWNSNKTSLTAVEEAFDDEPSPEHEKEEEPFPKDASTELMEGRDEGLRWFKKEFPQRVGK